MKVSYKDPIIFISSWNKDLGIKVEHFYPKSMNLDLEQIAMQIFIAYQNFFSIEKDEEINRSIFEIPIKNIIRKAKVLIDSIESERNNEKIPFIVVILFPDYILNEVLQKFNLIMENVAKWFLKTDDTPLSDEYDKIYELLLSEQRLKDSEIVIDENYTLNLSILDFKKGIEAFSKKKYQQAYVLLRKACLKFKNENNINLVLDSLFFIATALSELKKFTMAQEYYEELESLARSLNHQKYLETALFMEGFCAYKIEDYEFAIQKFTALEKLEKEHVNIFQFYFLYGRILRLTGQNELSLEKFQLALDIRKKLEQTDKDLEKIAQLLVEMGHLYYQMVIEIIKKGDIKQISQNSLLRKAVNYYDDSIIIWKKIENIDRLLIVYLLIGNIYDILNEPDSAIQNYNNSLKYAEISNDVFFRMQIYNQLIQQYQKTEQYKVLIKLLDQVLSNLRAYAFVDLQTISNYHLQLGKSLVKIGKKKEALSEFLIALNIYNQFEHPIGQGLDALQEIINIYKQEGQEKYFNYYMKQYSELQAKIQEYEAKQELHLEFRILNIVKELWFFTIEGVELLSIAPESKMNPQLFGGFISALQALSTELSSEKIRSVTIGSSNFFIYTENNAPIFIIGRSSLLSDENLIERVLKTLYQEFIKEFHPYLENYDGDNSRFPSFLDSIEKMNEQNLIS